MKNILLFLITLISINGVSQQRDTLYTVRETDLSGVSYFDVEGTGEKSNPYKLIISTKGSSAELPFKLKVNQGLIDGYSVIDKFGENPDVDTSTDPEDIWEVGGTYNHDTNGTAPIISLVSSSIIDTENISIQGLDIDGYVVNQIATLTGTARVTLETPLWRVYRMENEGSSSLVGSVSCYVGTSAVPLAENIRAQINNGYNQTLMALYTVPRGYVGFLWRGEVGLSKVSPSGVAKCAYYSRRWGKVFKIKKRFDLISNGSSIYRDERSFPDIIPSLTDMKITVEEVSTNGMGVWGAFDILLIEEDKFSIEFLQKIGQHGY